MYIYECVFGIMSWAPDIIDCWLSTVILSELCFTKNCHKHHTYVIVSTSSSCGPGMEFVKKFTQARFLKTKFYPKVRKSQWMQDRNKTA